MTGDWDIRYQWNKEEINGSTGTDGLLDAGIFRAQTTILDGGGNQIGYQMEYEIPFAVLAAGTPFDINAENPTFTFELETNENRGSESGLKRAAQYFWSGNSDSHWNSISNYGTINLLKSVAGINDISSRSKVLLYPNPVVNKLSIVNSSEVTSIVIIDIVGKEVLASTSGLNNIDVSGLKKGIYIATLYMKNGEKVNQKIEKK